MHRKADRQMLAARIEKLAKRPPFQRKPYQGTVFQLPDLNNENFQQVQQTEIAVLALELLHRVADDPVVAY